MRPSAVLPKFVPAANTIVLRAASIIAEIIHASSSVAMVSPCSTETPSTLTSAESTVIHVPEMTRGPFVAWGAAHVFSSQNVDLEVGRERRGQAKVVGNDG